ncbi:MAG: ChaN family lipoprotein [Alphaproteobacteria bacterium]|nr:ChaN family lipoprotein [Alphaproteobacteria bacterium]
MHADHPLVGRIWFPAERRFATPEELAQAAAQADFLLLGEAHDNPDHHALQAWMVRAVAALGRRPAVAFEMLDSSQAPALASHLASAPGDAAGLGSAVDWTKTGWPDWSTYQPIAQAALDHRLAIVTANLPRDEVRRVMKEGARPDGLTVAELPPPLHADLADEIRHGHCGHMPESMVAPMVAMQLVRDALMARALVQGAALPGSDSAVLIAGSGHVRADRGVPWQLRETAPGRVFALAFTEARPESDDPAAYGANWGAETVPFDAVWFTPLFDDTDPCAEMAKQMRDKGK